MTFSKEYAGPVVMILDGDYRLTLHLAEEVVRDLRGTVIGIGSPDDSPLLRSRYCHVRDMAPMQTDGEYQEAVLRLIHKHHPDAILTANHRSVAALDAVRDEAPEGIELCIPRSHALEASIDKSKTLAAAKRLGIGVPEDFTGLIRALDVSGRRDPEDLEQIPFPVFLKAAREAHAHIMAKVDTPSEFWPTYDGLRRRSGRWVEDDTVLVQEYVNADGHNYCYGFLFIDGEVELYFGHEKTRSIPREAGSAVRARVLHDERLRAMSEKLLRELEWGNGVALVEYKRRPDGSYVLMEINGRFWGAYALVKKSGYHFASTLVARKLGLPVKSPPASTPPKREMWFPRREVKWLLENREEASLPELAISIIAAGWPPCQWDVVLRDYRAWLYPGGARGLLWRRIRKRFGKLLERSSKTCK